MRIVLDSEFIEDGKTIELLSIALVREDGAELYLENSEADTSRASDWVRENVLPHLGSGRRRTRAEIAREIQGFAGASPEFWGYYADYDWVLLCQLYGPMMNLPHSWPMFCRDVQQLLLDRGNPELPPQEGDAHHALADARWIAQSLKLLLAIPAGIVPGDHFLRTPAATGGHAP